MVSKTFRGIMAISLLQSSLMARSADAPQAPAPAPAAPTEAAPVKYFPIMEYQVEGNTLMKTIDVERAVMPYLGEGKSIKDVEAARQNLEKIYHDHGYQTVLVNIPQQEVSSGVVRLSVVEAPVGQLQIKGSKYHSLETIEATVPQLQGGVVPNFNEVQKELAQVNHSDDLHVTPVLRASATPGQVDVDLNVQDQLPLHAMVEVNNRYSANTSQLRVIGEVSYDNLFQSNQSMSVEYQTAPEHPDQAKIWSVSYVIPMQNGLVWALYAIRSDSNIAAVGDLDVIGDGSIYGLRLIDPLPSSSPTFYHSFTAGFDYKDFKQNVTVQGSDSLASPAEYAPFTVQYSATWLGATAPAHQAAATTAGRSSTTFDLGTNFLIDGFGTEGDQFAVKRAGASPTYVIFHPGLQRQQVLPFSWSLVAKVDGQVASGPLISNEQFGAGGVESVRGYTESERLGDNGLRGSVELRTPQLLYGRPRFTSSYFYVFFDGARVRILDPLPAQRTGYDLASEGLGFRLKFGGLSTDLDGARADTQGYVTRIGSYSAQFRVNYAW
jgi:hemolysin activation/secretion protein